ncbi:MAG: hypothetical protein LBS50_11540 [Prevotellaceae bacterium]|nr:hypothetical protein [Prevotellaceae bacterium]
MIKLEFILKFLKKIVSVLFTRETVIFLHFLLLAVFFWCMHSVGTQNELTVNVPVKYEDIPQNVKIRNTLPAHISVLVKEEGLSVLRHLIVAQADTLRLSFDGINSDVKNGTKVFTLDSLSYLVAMQFESDVKILHYEPKVIVAEYITLKHKTLPIFIQDSVLLMQHYILTDKIRIEPESVEVFGSENELKDLTKIFVEPLSLDSLGKTQKISRQLIEPEGVALSNRKVKITIPVDRATEKIIAVPVQCANFPSGFYMRSFPSEVTVKFVVAMSRFNQILAKDFTIEANFLQKTSDFGVPLSIVNQPFNIENLRIEPEQVEFSLEKK